MSLCGVQFLAALLGLLGLLLVALLLTNRIQSFISCCGVLCCMWPCLLCFDAGDGPRRFLGAFMAFSRSAPGCLAVADALQVIRLYKWPSTGFYSVLALCKHWRALWPCGRAYGLCRCFACSAWLQVLRRFLALFRGGSWRHPRPRVL